MYGKKRFMVALFLAGTVTGLRADDQEGATNAPTAAPRVELTYEEMARSTAQIHEQLRDVLQQMMSLQTRAREKKDVIKLNCVNDKLVQAKAQMNIADGQSATLQTSLDKRSSDAQAEYQDLRDTSTRISSLKEEAAACMGETELYKQESGVEVERTEIVDDPTDIDPYPEEIEPAAYESPFS